MNGKVETAVASFLENPNVNSGVFIGEGSDDFTLLSDIQNGRVELVNIKEEYVTDEDDVEGGRVLEEEKEVEESTLEANVNAWPVAIHFEAVREEDCSGIDDTDSYKDSTEGDYDEESCVDNENSSDISVNTSDGRKRRKVLKMRKPKAKGHLNSQFKCNECSIQYSTQTELSIHLYSAHKIDNHFYLDDRIVCRLCKRTFTNKLYLEAHINQMHTENRVINCIKCKKVFKYRSYLTTKNAVHGTAKTSANNTPTYKTFTCFHCNCYPT